MLAARRLQLLAAALTPPRSPTPQQARGAARPAPARSVQGAEEAEFPLVAVAGTAYEMGQQHGAQVMSFRHDGCSVITASLKHQHGVQAASLIQLYMAHIAPAGAAREACVRDALSYVGGIEAMNPRYIEEVRGLP